MIKRNFILTLLCLCLASAAFAQRHIIKPGAVDGFLFRVRASGQTYMVPNVRIGQEALNKGMLSHVGEAPLTLKEKTQYKAYQWGKKHLTADRLENLVRRQWAKAPFPAQYQNFEKAWMNAREKIKLKLTHLEVVLEAAYGADTTFDGAFVTSYREILSALQEERNVLTAKHALERAYKQGLERKTGFFIITVHESEEHGHDVLLLDLENQNFISLGKSIGAAWLEEHKPQSMWLE